MNYIDTLSTVSDMLDSCYRSAHKPIPLSLNAYDFEELKSELDKRFSEKKKITPEEIAESFKKQGIILNAADIKFDPDKKDIKIIKEDEFEVCLNVYHYQIVKREKNALIWEAAKSYRTTSIIPKKKKEEPLLPCGHSVGYHQTSTSGFKYCGKCNEIVP